MSKVAQDWVNEGELLIDSGKPEQALECFTKAIGLQSNFAPAYFYKGRILAELGKKKEAIGCFDSAISLMPDNSSCYLNKAYVLDEMGEKEKAIECYDKVIELKPDSDIAYLNKGALLDELGRNEQAIGCYDKVIELKGQDYADAYINKGNTLIRLGKKEEAVESYNQGLIINPNHPFYLYSRGKCLIFLNKNKEAVADLKKTHDILASGKSAPNIAKEDLPWINDFLKPIFEIYDLATKTETYVKRIKNPKPEIKELLDRFEAFKVNYDKIETNVLRLFIKHGEGEYEGYKDDIEKLKKEIKVLHDQLEIENRQYIKVKQTKCCNQF